MKQQEIRIFSKQELLAPQSIIPNLWDIIAFLLIFIIIFLLGWGALQMTYPYQLGEVIKISLSPTALPYYALRSVIRMMIALFFSLLFTLTVGTLAAKNKTAEKFIIPIIDIMQSIPVLGILSISIWGFIALFPGSQLGPECAAIFAIFTAQVWNITLSFYQSLRTVPDELVEAALLFQLSSWQRFWRVDVPFATPGLLWNSMVSLSAGWFFVVASEAFSVAHQTIMLPGIGSYIAEAISQANLRAIGYAIFAMFIVILIYDQLILRPFIQWAEKFKHFTSDEEKQKRPWIIVLFQKARFLRYLGHLLHHFGQLFIDFHLNRFSRAKKTIHFRTHKKHLSYNLNQYKRPFQMLCQGLTLLLVIGMVYKAAPFIQQTVTLPLTKKVILLGAITALRITILIAICLIIWVPIGVWIGLRPQIRRFVQPFIQFLAAFPANLLFPLFVIAIVKFHLNVEIWTSPLMILGTQWYILFNVIAGTSLLAQDIQYVTNLLQVKGWLRWRRVILPGIFPHLLTGTLSAAGGAWNASVVAEAVSWGSIKLKATGLGALITESTTQGDSSGLAMGITAMCLYVLVINRIIWRPLYNRITRK